ncbi:MAG: terminase small subunit [Victivallales bacterium]|nr:terminase small subunit [Victivallales bacterium]
MPRTRQLPANYDGSGPLPNPRHEAFCVAYVGEQRGNAAASYRAAGYKTKKRHPDAAAGQRLLTFVDIQKRIAHLENELAEKEKLKAIDAIRHLKAVATVTLADFIGSGGHIDIKKLRDPALAQAIQEITPIFDKDGCLLDYRIKLKDSMKALQLLGLAEADQPGGVQQVLVINV